MMKYLDGSMTQNFQSLLPFQGDIVDIVEEIKESMGGTAATDVGTMSMVIISKELCFI